MSGFTAGKIYHLCRPVDQLVLRLSLHFDGASIGNLPPLEDFVASGGGDLRLGTREIGIGVPVDSATLRWTGQLERNPETNAAIGQIRRLHICNDRANLPTDIQRSLKPTKSKTEIFVLARLSDSGLPSTDGLVTFTDADVLALHLQQLDHQSIVAYPSMDEPISVVGQMGQFTLRVSDDLQSNEFGGSRRNSALQALSRDASIEEHPDEASAFVHPDEGVVRAVFNVIIDEAIGFESFENLLLEWHVDAGSSATLLSGPATNFGVRSYGLNLNGGMRRFHFGETVELCFDFGDFGDLGGASNNGATSSSRLFPRLFLKLTTEDGWGRHYVAGYASISLLSNLNSHLVVDCFRPSASCPAEHLAEYFVGQAKDIDGFEAAPKVVSSGSGQIKLRIETIVQCRQLAAAQYVKNARISAALRRIGVHGELHWRITRALLEFEEARRRLLLAQRTEQHTS